MSEELNSVEAVDRIAARAILFDQQGGETREQRLILDGEFDDHPLVLALAKHRAPWPAASEWEAVAWRRMNHLGTASTGVTDTTFYRDLWTQEGADVRPLYAQPAPSDQEKLLEALEPFAEAARSITQAADERNRADDRPHLTRLDGAVITYGDWRRLLALITRARNLGDTK